MSEELIERLRERYTAEPIPPCSVCGAALSIQSAGGGHATVYGCNSTPFDLKHYERSRWTQYRPGDAGVLELIERLSTSQARLSEAVKVLEEMLGYMSDIKGLIDQRHESGEMVDGGDLRYWSSLIEFALSKATIGG